MSIANDTRHGVLSLGVSRPFIDGAYTGGGTIERLYVSVSGGVAIGAFIRSITGTVNIKCYTAGKGDREEELEIITFPTISSPTTEIMLRHSPKALSFIRLVVTYSGDVDLLITAQNITAMHAMENVRMELQNAPDSSCVLTYADAGTLDERITAMTYTAASVPATTLVKTITYTLSSGSYVATAVDWSVS